MFSTLKTLMRAGTAEANEALIDANAVTLLGQKIREAEAAHDGAKRSLAMLIVQLRTEEKQLASLKATIEKRCEQAQTLANDGKQDLLEEVAGTIAQLENEQASCQQTIDGLKSRIARLQSTVENAQRQLQTLRQKLVQAKTNAQECRAQQNLNGSITGYAALREAKDLVGRIDQAPDMFAQVEAYDDLNDALEGKSLDKRLQASGIKTSDAVDTASVLSRFQKNNKS